MTSATPRRIHHRSSRSAPRIAMYSHDTMGIGHVRRNLLIAQLLADGYSEATILLVAGARQAGLFDLPPRTDMLTLPSLYKRGDGGYQSRELGIPFWDLIAMRSEALRAAIMSFDPDVLIVDKVPRGVGAELDDTLEALGQRGRARCVLGLRDVLDDAESVRHEWQVLENERTIRDYYDAVWVYGDRKVCDPVHEYGFSRGTADKLRYVGYLDQRPRLAAEAVNGSREIRTDSGQAIQLPAGRLVVCALGGGHDGARLGEAFAQVRLPADTSAILLAGPYMPSDARKRIRHLTQDCDCFQVVDFVAEPSRIVARADRVIAMGGYNTVCEVLSYNKPALIIPRTMPRREQLIRAQRLQELGLIDMLHPDRLSPQAIEAWIGKEIGRRPATEACIQLSGPPQLHNLMAELLQTASCP
ncbi:MAG: glycosyltransferase family protein [Pirellulales bacterium]